MYFLSLGISGSRDGLFRRIQLQLLEANCVIISALLQGNCYLYSLKILPLYFYLCITDLITLVVTYKSNSSFLRNVPFSESENSKWKL